MRRPPWRSKRLGHLKKKKDIGWRSMMKGYGEIRVDAYG